jgi:hypothetical protein
MDFFKPYRRLDPCYVLGYLVVGTMKNKKSG